MVYALNKYRHYLLRKKFIFLVDHMAIVVPKVWLYHGLYARKDPWSGRRSVHVS